ncbi:hypothetical protein JCGZ_13018 [Jatropha curcas]|uniref:Uncharacterized protein n=1 Tax=Jatropha curcas TaxID=180498 RepID=A0A067KA38_JATCU|nr:hypothetical protein JCGZ_13018 [Jatropha curcas]
MAHKLKNVNGKLDAIANEKQKFHLREGEREIEGSEDFDRRQTGSLVNELEICGRDKEKEELVNLVLSNSDDFSVYAVCGMGGLGKTTLAQLVYNDKRVESHFHMRIWVCVSDDFDIMRLTRAIIESIEGSPCNNQELDPLQRSLQEKLSGRKYLFVLDDVWNEYHDKWEKLINVLRCGTQGSAVIVTTRMEKVALMMATAPVQVQHMNRLSDNDSWLLFERHAFRMRDKEDYTHLEAIGKDIVKKCGGVPLAVKALGSMMLFKRKESEWLAIKESNIWDMPDDGKTILPALKLSYDHLLPHLRQCLSFCSVFPKDYAMKKDQLVELWIANGFISSRGGMDLHDMGHEIFNELVLRSFFEDIKEDFYGDTRCKLHDLVHDLAQSVMKYECCFIEPNKTLEVSKVVRHLAFSDGNYWLPSPRNKDLHKIRSLRSFLVTPSSGDFLPFLIKQKHLRALCIFNIEKWPISIDKLKHLRYLDFSRSAIKSLPESITSLQKLQTLDLRYCPNLFKLPNGLKHMKDLKYLHITGCDELTCIPPGIGQLTRLRKLSMFIVGKDAGQQIGELRSLNLDGKLSIKGLDNVKDLTDARSANLTSKKNLEWLELIWQQGNGNNSSTENIEETLCGLQPHSNVKKLSIEGYEGFKVSKLDDGVTITKSSGNLIIVS